MKRERQQEEARKEVLIGKSVFLLFLHTRPKLSVRYKKKNNNGAEGANKRSRSITKSQSLFFY